MRKVPLDRLRGQQQRSNRTLHRDLRRLEATLWTIDHHGRAEPGGARIELSYCGDDVVAQVVSMKLRRPVAARGRSIAHALRHLVDVAAGD
jgi:hypothetical protein